MALRRAGELRRAAADGRKGEGGQEVERGRPLGGGEIGMRSQGVVGCRDAGT